jgi:hypothetical protein
MINPILIVLIWYIEYIIIIKLHYSIWNKIWLKNGVKTGLPKDGRIESLRLFLLMVGGFLLLCLWKAFSKIYKLQPEIVQGGILVAWGIGEFLFILFFDWWHFYKYKKTGDKNRSESD